MRKRRQRCGACGTVHDRGRCPSPLTISEEHRRRRLQEKADRLNAALDVFRQSGEGSSVDPTP